MDRRTRVVCKAESLGAMWEYIHRTKNTPQPGVIVLDADHCGSADTLRATLLELHRTVNPLRVLCQSLYPDEALITTAIEGGAAGYLIKSEVRYHIAWVVACAFQNEFVITPGIAQCHPVKKLNKSTLIRTRAFSNLTKRQREVLEFTLLEGMPAKVLADELLIGYQTVRGHIRDGYDILRAEDDLEFPERLSEEERAFMRLTRPEDN
ncbi:MAG: LuxR C-terminal-related transcriptional regulator [Chloroflexota bacterium]|nr:LuxR C-terminal-related transcriptional regulator [Chloroflexota bacterium]